MAGSQRCTVGALALADRRGRRGHATRDGVELVRLENRKVQAADEPLRQGRNRSCQAHFSSTGSVFESRHLRISQTGWRAVSSLVLSCGIPLNCPACTYSLSLFAVGMDPVAQQIQRCLPCATVSLKGQPANGKVTFGTHALMDKVRPKR